MATRNESKQAGTDKECAIDNQENQARPREHTHNLTHFWLSLNLGFKKEGYRIYSIKSCVLNGGRCVAVAGRVWPRRTHHGVSSVDIPGSRYV
eukprot:1329807-Amorphochlora_amoeboformis.AAC.1